MSAARIAASVAAVALLAAGCSGQNEPSPREVLQSKCLAAGGVYFEYEATSAGAHVWCVKADGEDIADQVSEGD